MHHKLSLNYFKINKMTKLCFDLNEVKWGQILEFILQGFLQKGSFSNLMPPITREL